MSTKAIQSPFVFLTRVICTKFGGNVIAKLTVQHANNSDIEMYKTLSQALFNELYVYSLI